MKNKITKGDTRELIKKVEDNSVSVVFTDVPYLISQGGNAESSVFGWNNGTKDFKNNGKLFNHNDIKPDEYLPDLYRVLEDTGHIYLMVNNTHLANIVLEMEKVGFIINNILVMVKNNAVTNQHYMKNCEFTIFARKGGSKGLNDFGIKSAISVDMPNGKDKLHITEKPLKYVQQLIKNSTKHGDIVLDPFCGSGVVANACINLGLDYICFKIDDKYYKVASERVKKANGNVGLFA